MNIPFIDLKSQYEALRIHIHERINEVLDHGQYIMGPEVQLLEEKLATYTGAKHCITVASGTEALLISLMALGIKSGDEVITTPFTFAATVEVIVLLGAKPVFVDIQPDTCNIDPSKIEEKITSKTKAIIPVSLYGQPSDMDQINAISVRYGNIPVIEDAAQSFGASYRGRKSCNLSTIGCTSFFPSKPLGCYGDGGAIFTNDDLIAQACKEIRVHGQSTRYVHTRVGVGGRMDTLQCAILLAKLERFDWEVERRTEIGWRYSELLSTSLLQLQSNAPADVEGYLTRVNASLDNLAQKLPSVSSDTTIAPITIRPDRTSVHAQYTLICADREAIQSKLKKAAIPTAVHYPIPLNEQAAYRNLCCVDCTPIARKLAKQVLSLPMSPYLTPDQQAKIVFTLRSEREE